MRKKRSVVMVKRGERKAKDEMGEAYAEDDQDKKGRPCRR
jgi:hypothetical protein